MTLPARMHAATGPTGYMRAGTVPIDERIAPLIEQLWRLGFQTRFCCEGDDPAVRSQKPLLHGYGGTAAAYILFSSYVEACLFASLAGPVSWGYESP